MSVNQLFVMLFMVIIFPMIILCINIDTFIIAMSALMIFTAVGNLYYLMTSSTEAHEQDELESEEMEQEFWEAGDVLGINVHKLGYGFAIAVDILVIAYFMYSLFFTKLFIIKAVAIILIADWVYDIIYVVDILLNPPNNSSDDMRYTWKDRLYELYVWIHNIAVIFFVLVIFTIKYL